MIVSSALLLTLAGCASDPAGSAVACDAPQDAQSGSADGSGLGEVGANTAPSIEFITPAEGAFVLLGSPVPVLVHVADDGGATQVTVKIALKGDAAILYEGKAGVNGIMTSTIMDLPAGARTLVATATDSAGASATVERKVYVNTAPGAPVVSIAPTKPSTLDTLTATVVAEAVDVDRKSSELKYTFAWRRDDQPTSQVTATVPPGVAKRGEVWQVIVTAADLYVAGGMATASVTVDDAAPSTPTVALSTGDVDLKSEVTCAVAVAAIDADGDAITYQYQWWMDGVPADAATSATVVVASLKSGSTAINTGAKLQCKVTANDGTKSGAPGSSAEVVVKGFDVCASELNPCSPHADCTGTDTLKVLCACKPGYSGDGAVCTDVNECTNGTAVCALTANCTNSDGAFGCTCKPGYAGDGKTCVDIDECLAANGGCGDAKYILCQNAIAGPAVCSDINECANNNGGCGDVKVTACNNNYAKAQTCGAINSCVGNNGGCGDAKYWACKENAGAAPSCSDIDQCKTNNGGCGDAIYYTCANKIGAPQVCADIDECKTNNGGCGGPAFVTCVNKVGAAPSCSDIDECKVNNGGCGSATFFSCKNNLASAQTCADIDECLTNNGGCGSGNCSNNTGAAPTCSCTVAKGPAVVDLATAGNYVVLAKSAISTVPASSVTGDMGLSPAAASYITGFALVADATKVFATSSQVAGKVYASNYAVPTPGTLTTAIVHMQAAYTDAAGRTAPDFVGLGGGNIGGKTLAPGLYKWTNSVTIPTDLILAGCANDVWIFQITGDMSMAAGKKITLTGGAQAKNVVWQVAGIVSIGAAAHFEGTILGKQSITLLTNATMNGRAMAQTMVALEKATIGL